MIGPYKPPDASQDKFEPLLGAIDLNRIARLNPASGAIEAEMAANVAAEHTLEIRSQKTVRMQL